MEVTNFANLTKYIALVDVPEHMPTRRGRKMSNATVYRLAKAGKLRVYKISGVLYTDAGSIEALVQLKGRGSPPPSLDNVTEAQLRAKGLVG